MEKKHFENRLKIICFVKSWPPGVIKLEKNTSKFLGPIVQRDQLSWGPFVHGDQMSRYCLFLWTNCLGDHFPWGPNEPGLFAHGDQLWGTKCPGTECVRDQMRCSPRGGKPKYFAPTKALIVVQSNLVIRNVLIKNKLVLRNHFPWSNDFIRIRNFWR